MKSREAVLEAQASNLELFEEPKEEHPALKARNVKEFVKTLKGEGCEACPLAHEGRNQIVVFRGNPEATFMVVGEAPGAVEDSSGLPFSGPAGRKLDEILRSIGTVPNRDFYIGNIVKCRPIDHTGAKQNTTPTSGCARACRPFIAKEIKLIKPEVVICAGLTAARHLMNLPANTRMRQLAGTIHTNPEFPGTDFIPIYHPAAILHSSREPEKCYQIRKSIWDTMTAFKERYIAGRKKVVGAPRANRSGDA